MALACLVILAWTWSQPDWWGETPETEPDRQLQEEVEFLMAHPLDVNSASLDELLAIPWISPILAQRIVATRARSGPYKNLNGLLVVPGLSQAWLDALAPVLTVGRAARPWQANAVLRARADSLPAGWLGGAYFARVRVSSGPWSGFALAEKDAGETSVFDCTAFGGAWQGSHARVALGDFTFGAGQGLVYSAPSRLGSDWAGPSGQWQFSSGQPGYAPEPVRLRGISGQYSLGRWTIAAFGSRAYRDARLNADGTALRLVIEGTHDDSAARASRNTVRELSSGAAGGFRWPGGVVVATAGFSGFSRVFAPSDSASGFYGTTVADASVSTRLQLDDYVLAAEVAGASTGGFAVAARVDGEWPGLAVSVAATDRRGRYFAPHGRWSSTTVGADRLNVTGRLVYRPGWFEAGLGGGTYYNYETDSIPARLDLWTAAHLGQLVVGVKAGRRLRADAATSRTAACNVEYRPGRASRLRVVLADEYPEQTSGRGRMAAVLADWRSRAVTLALSGERFDISGSGVTMSVSEPGPMRTGASYSTNSSCWRAAGSVSYSPWSGGRIGLRSGCTWRPSPTLDLSAQIEAGFGSD
jgi:hypothetical protein